MEPLLSLLHVVVRTPAREEVGPITWEIGRPSRTWLEVALPGHLEALVGLLSGRLQPVRGQMREHRTVHIQTDAHLRAALRPGHTIDEFLHSPDAPEHVWLEGRRRSLGVLLDRLGFSPHHFRRALRLQPPEVFERYLALRFIVSRAELLIGAELWNSPDPLVRAALAQRWLDFPGAVVVAAPRGALPGPVQFHARLDATGGFSLEEVAGADDEPRSLEGSGPGGGPG